MKFKAGCFITSMLTQYDQIHTKNTSSLFTCMMVLSIYHLCYTCVITCIIRFVYSLQYNDSNVLTKQPIEGTVSDDKISIA